MTDPEGMGYWGVGYGEGISTGWRISLLQAVENSKILEFLPR